VNELEFEDQFYREHLPRLLRSALFRRVDERKCAFIAGRLACAGPSILSIGCGDARKETLLARHASRIVGVDICGRAVQLASDRVRCAGLSNVRVFRGDALKERFEPGTFDAVLAIGLLHHLTQRESEAIVRRSFTWLRSGGVMVTNDPQRFRLVGLFRGLYAEACREMKSATEHDLDVGATCALFKAAGFERVVCRYTDFFLDPFAWLYPGFPSAFIPGLVALDSLLLGLPGLRRLASHFSVVAVKPGADGR